MRTVRYLRPAVAAAVAVTVTLAAPAPAHAASEAWISTATVTPTYQVVDGDAGCSSSRARIDVEVYDPDQQLGSSDLNAEVTDASNGSVDSFITFYFESRSGDRFNAHGNVFSCASLETPGKYHAKITLEWWDNDDNPRASVRDRYFTLVRPTSLTHNASPEPVKRGAALTHSGRLMFDPYSYGAMYGASGVTVKIYFRKYNTTAYVYKGSATTGSGGYYTRRLTAWDSGVWKAVYAGTSGRQAQTVYDAVSVRS